MTVTNSLHYTISIHFRLLFANPAKLAICSVQNGTLLQYFEMCSIVEIEHMSWMHEFRILFTLHAKRNRKTNQTQQNITTTTAQQTKYFSYHLRIQTNKNRRSTSSPIPLPLFLSLSDLTLLLHKPIKRHVYPSPSALISF